MAVAAEYLPAETEAARTTEGRSEVDRLLDQELLPHEVMMHTAGRSVDPGEAGWWVELRGDHEALSALSERLGDDPIQVTERGGQFFLRSEEFEEVDDEQAVRLRATTLLREASGASWLDDAPSGSVEVGAVRRIA